MFRPGCRPVRIPILFLAAVICSVHLDALDPNRKLTQYIHRSWQTEQGLAEVQIDSLAQTRDGYLWLGTYTGLVRFDGVRFTAIAGPKRVLESVWIRTVVEDAAGTLWIGTNDAGLIQLHDGAMTQYSTSSGLTSNLVFCVIPTAGGEVWACTGDGMVRIANGKVQVYGVEQGLGSPTVYAACKAPGGTLWAGSEISRVSSWDRDGFRMRQLQSVPADTPIRGMLCTDDGTVWVGTIRGLIQLRNGKERLFTTRDGLVSNHVLCLKSSRDGSLLIGTNNGFSRMRNGEFESFGPDDGLSQRMVYAIQEDHEGSLWVGTMHGLDQFLDGRSVPYTAREGLPSNHVGPVAADHKGNVWVGTLDRGLGRFDGSRFLLPGGEREGSPKILSILDDGSSGLWVGSDTGLTFLRNGRPDRTYTTADGLPSNTVRCLFRDHAGVLWAGTPLGPAKLEDRKFVQPRIFKERLQTPIIAIGEDRGGQLYFGSELRGLYIYGHGSLRELWLNDGAPPRITAFYLDPAGLFWMTAEGRGLRLVRDGKVVSYGMKDGLFDNVISGLVADGQDRIWLACSKGIFSLNRSDLLAFADGKVRKLVANPIDPSRAIECVSGVTPTAARGSDGRLWFSTRDGVMVFDPNHMARRVPPPSVVIEGVTVNGESTLPAKIERIPPGRRNLEFRYTGLSLLDPSRITFRYILEGFEKEWTDAATRREAFYTNLPPGKYHFRVTACNADGVCNERGNSVEFALAPYYYQNPWFLPVCGIGVAGIAGLAHRLRVRHLRNQLSLVVAERSRIARELHDTLIQGFSGLTLQLQAMSGRLGSAEERETLKDIIRDAGTYLRETRQSVASLRSEQAPHWGLASAIAEFARQVTAEAGIRLRLKLDENLQDLPAQVQYNLLRIAQEAISNSVKHSGGRSIEVVLAGSPAEVSLSVKDDGSGLEKQENEDSDGGHYGLIGMHERAAEIGGNLELASVPGKGTTVSVLVPASRGGKGAPSRNGWESVH